MKATETTRTRVNTGVTATPTVEERISGSTIAAFFAGSALIGLWSMAAMVGGLVTAGGPVGLVKGFTQAVLGV